MTADAVNWRDDAASVDALWRHAAERFAARPLIEFEAREISYGELADAVDRTAARLAALGIAPGAIVAIHLPNSPYFVIALLAAFRLGCGVVNLSPLDSPREIKFKLGDTGARVLFTSADDSCLANARALLTDGTIDHAIVCDDASWRRAPPAWRADRGMHDLAALLREPIAAVARAAVKRDDLALIQYTGGTTGAPKGAVLTHANLLDAARIFDGRMHAEPTARPGEERHVAVLPLFHIYALVGVLLRAIRNGEMLMLRARFDPDQVLRDIGQGRATWFFAVPTMLIALLECPRIAECDFASLSYCISGGAPLPQEVADRFAAATGVRPVVGWGMTETSGAGTLGASGESTDAGRVGKPLPDTRIEIVAMDDAARVLRPGEVGEVRIAGPQVMRGYWQRPEETAAAFGGGMLLTGDVGYFDPDGILVLVDRKKDLIISSGYNVYPRVVEDAIYEHPAVEEVLVYGAPDSYRGEIAVAAVKLRASAGTLSLEGLRGFLADRLGRHELPAALEIHDALPRTAVGKLSRKELRSVGQQREAR